MITLRHADICLQLDETDGGRATSWTVAGHELIGRNGTHPIDYGMYPMAPWAGRLRGNAIEWSGVARPLPVNFDPWAIHGLVLNRRFEVIEKQAHHVLLQCAFDEVWPASGAVQCSWTLDDDGLTTEITCTSRAEAFPAILGWHPWFRRQIAGTRAEWATDCDQQLVRGADSLPTGECIRLDRAAGPFDDVLTGGTAASIDWPGFLRIDIENSHPWFVVYDATEDFICIEPQTGPADGLSGRCAPVTLVSAAEPLMMRTRWLFRRAPQAPPA